MKARYRSLAPLFALTVACASNPTPNAMAPAPDTVRVVDTVRVPVAAEPDPEVEERLARLQFQVFERDAQLQELRRQRDDAIQEVVRAMARLQTLATRAEAASAMAEAEIALEALTNAGGEEEGAEADQARHLLEMSTVEFNNQNYGGALYLASQARRVAGGGQARVSAGGEDVARADETLFALPLPLQAARRSNVRSGPGLEFAILFTVDAAAPLTGFAYADRWVRITDDQGRSGWIFHNLVASREMETGR